MRNPFRGESDAYRTLLLVGAVAIPAALVGYWGHPWVALGLAVAATVAAIVLSVHRRGRERQLRSAPAHVGPPDERRILVVACDTLTEERLAHEIERSAAGSKTRVLVLAPVLVSSVRHWCSDVDSASAKAERRLDEAAGRIRGDIAVATQVADEDPLQAIEDALRTFGGDEIIIATRREGSAHGLDPRLADLVRERFALPVEHLVLDDEKLAAGTLQVAPVA